MTNSFGSIIRRGVVGTTGFMDIGVAMGPKPGFAGEGMVKDQPYDLIVLRFDAKIAVKVKIHGGKSHGSNAQIVRPPLGGVIKSRSEKSHSEGMTSGIMNGSYESLNLVVVKLRLAPHLEDVSRCPCPRLPSLRLAEGVELLGVEFPKLAGVDIKFRPPFRKINSHVMISIEGSKVHQSVRSTEH
jgi:hypothetical protein